MNWGKKFFGYESNPNEHRQLHGVLPLLYRRTASTGNVPPPLQKIKKNWVSCRILVPSVTDEFFCTVSRLLFQGERLRAHSGWNLHAPGQSRGGVLRLVRTQKWSDEDPLRHGRLPARCHVPLSPHASWCVQQSAKQPDFLNSQFEMKFLVRVQSNLFPSFSDGSCGHQEITMLGRNGEFSEEVKEELVSRVPAACAQPSDFVQVSTTRQYQQRTPCAPLRNESREHSANRTRIPSCTGSHFCVSGECHIRPSTEPVPSCKISDLRSGNRVDWTHVSGSG